MQPLGSYLISRLPFPWLPAVVDSPNGSHSKILRNTGAPSMVGASCSTPVGNSSLALPSFAYRI